MSDPPTEVRDLAQRRQAARERGDFGTADSLRQAIRARGFEVTDTPGGPVLVPRPLPQAAPVYARSEDVPSVLGSPPSSATTFQWVVQGWPEDVVRGISSVQAALSEEVQHVVVDAAGLGDYQWPSGVEVIRVSPVAGWAVARNAGLRRAAGEVVVLVDGSIELTGDPAGVWERLQDPTVGVCGPFGVVTDDLNEFRESEGPEVDAIEGYFLALRRELVENGLRFDERFKFYRMADIELCFQVKAMELRVVVVPAPVARHEHRMWATTSEVERARLSKRNFYRFLDRWRGRTDLLVSPGERGSPG